eukprot:1142806-Pyramimonas_sp.AAC.1
MGRDSDSGMFREWPLAFVSGRFCDLPDVASHASSSCYGSATIVSKVQWIAVDRCCARCLAGH